MDRVDYFNEVGEEFDPDFSKKDRQQTKTRTDISDQIEKKIESKDETSIYYQSEKIGQILKKGPGYLYEMSEGFEFENETFYKDNYQEPRKYPKSYVEETDMGWS
ncbi:DUF2553 family protein [Salipaludibacillus daqingensis]|uniref:DUF2553 family protein n=1 Tax=Salipaludibacillus daqingensis TaxID=3041001 RepID=UPI002472ECDF|nr:DUF2553 family protein [Salipaludibacillus daqingensis]